MSPRESTASPCGEMNWPGSSPAAGAPSRASSSPLSAVDADARPEVGHVVVDAPCRRRSRRCRSAGCAALHDTARRAGACCSTASRTCRCRRTPARDGSRGRRRRPSRPRRSRCCARFELARIGAGLAPRQEQLAVRRVLVHARSCRSRRRRRCRPAATARCACSGGTARRSCTAPACRECRSSAAPCRRACTGARCGRRRR